MAAWRGITFSCSVTRYVTVRARCQRGACNLARNGRVLSRRGMADSAYVDALATRGRCRPQKPGMFRRFPLQVGLAKKCACWGATLFSHWEAAGRRHTCACRGLDARYLGPSDAIPSDVGPIGTCCEGQAWALSEVARLDPCLRTLAVFVGHRGMDGLGPSPEPHAADA